MADKEIKATSQQLKKAFKAHGSVAKDGDSIAHHLLKFYASECGLKALFLIKHSLADTSYLEGKTGQKHGYGHDLQRWLDELMMPPLKSSNIKSDLSPIRQIHEKLRYGVDASPAHKQFLEELYSKLAKDKNLR